MRAMFSAVAILAVACARPTPQNDLALQCNQTSCPFEVSNLGAEPVELQTGMASLGMLAPHETRYFEGSGYRGGGVTAVVERNNQPVRQACRPKVVERRNNTGFKYECRAIK
jgi:hypothetical protein